MYFAFWVWFAAVVVIFNKHNRQKKPTQQQHAEQWKMEGTATVGW